MGMKYVRIDKRTVIQVSSDIPDKVAIERYREKTMNYDKSIEKIKKTFKRKK